MTPIFYSPLQVPDYDFVSVRKIPEFVEQSGRAPCSQFVGATPKQLSMVHSSEYVEAMLEGRRKNGFGNTRTDIAQAARHSVGNILAATRWVLGAKTPVACSATQGFHHAHYDDCYGYCTFNGLVLAAIAAIIETGESALIVDGDAHEGDGTMDIIRRKYLYDEIHCVGRAEMTAGTRPEWGARMWEAYVEYLIDRTRPGIILYQAGADAWVEDPYGAGYLTLDAMRERDRGVFEAARRLGVPLVWNLAGGYSEPMQKVIDIHLQTLKTCDEVYYGR